MCLGLYNGKEQVQLRADTAWEESVFVAKFWMLALVFLAPKPRGDLSQLNYTCPLGRLLRPKPLKIPDSFI